MLDGFESTYEELKPALSGVTLHQKPCSFESTYEELKLFWLEANFKPAEVLSLPMRN